MGENIYQLCFASNQSEAAVLLVLSVFRPLVLTIYTLVRIPVQTQTETLIFWWNNISKISKLCSAQLYLVHLYGIRLFSNRALKNHHHHHQICLRQHSMWYIHTGNHTLPWLVTWQSHERDSSFLWYLLMTMKLKLYNVFFTYIKLIVSCRSCIILVRAGNNSIVYQGSIWLIDLYGPRGLKKGYKSKLFMAMKYLASIPSAPWSSLWLLSLLWQGIFSHTREKMIFAIFYVFQCKYDFFPLHFKIFPQIIVILPPSHLSG